MIKKCFLTVAALTATMLNTPDAQARDFIRGVGSSTVYPFVTIAAEEHGNKSAFKTPVIESTGTGGGFKLFCEGIGTSYPDISNASRVIKDSERKICAKNGITNITEIKIGYDGIILANNIHKNRFDLTKEQIFLALAKKIPGDNGQLIDNPHTKWSDIDASLPNHNIIVYGPPPTSGTRDAFVELVLEKACKDLPAFKAAFPDKKTRQKQCHLIREDHVFIEAGENDNLIVQKLIANPEALGIFGFSGLDQNGEQIQGSTINGVEPEFENIADGSYAVSRPLYVYVKNAHFTIVDGLKEFVEELISNKAIGDEGYLIDKGLIPLTEEERTKLQQTIQKSLKNSR